MPPGPLIDYSSLRTVERQSCVEIHSIYSIYLKISQKTLSLPLLYINVYLLLIGWGGGYVLS